MHADIYSKHSKAARATAHIMAETALLALRARVVNIAKVPGRPLRGLRVVFLGAGSENMWGLRREAGVNMRDKKIRLGGRCHLISPGCSKRGSSGGIMGEK